MTEPRVFRIVIERRDADGTWEGVFFAGLRPRDYGYLALLLSGVDMAAFSVAPVEEQVRIVRRVATPQPAPASVN